MMIALSLAALALAPLIYTVVKRYPPAFKALDGFVLITVGALVALYVLPPAIAAAGGWAVVVAVVGLITPMVMERLAGSAVQKAHNALMLLALLGLALHAAVDGMVLSDEHNHSHASALAVAVVLHRLPVGLAVWWLLKPKLGVTAAISWLLVLAGATVGGYYGAEFGAQFLQGTALTLVQAFVAGSLLHVLIFGPVHKHDLHDAGWAIAETIGALVGLGVLLLLPLLGAHPHSEGLSGYGERLLRLSLESAPALLIGYLLAGAVTEAFPKASLGWVSRGSHFSQAARGVVLGIPIPICSCGVIPVYRGFIEKGLPPAAAMAFLVATPELGIESLLLSIPLLGGKLTIARLLAAIFVALITGWLVGRVATVAASTTTTTDEPELRPPLRQRIGRALSYGLRDSVDDTAMWIIVGLAIAAAVNPQNLSGWIHRLPAGADVLLFALAGIPVYVCASGATPIAAALVLAGASPGAALAFLLAGPATNVTTFGVLSKLHSRRTALLFGGTVFASACAVSFAVNVIIGSYLPPEGITGTRHEVPLYQWIALSVLISALCLSLLRMGPRAALAELFQLEGGGHGHGQGGEHGHDHSHGHDAQGRGHAHDHSARCHGHDHD